MRKAAALIVLAVLAVGLTVNTIVTDRETEPASADIGHRDAPRRQAPGSRGRVPQKPRDRAAARLRGIDALVDAGRATARP
jgi:hypothetical protein